MLLNKIYSMFKINKTAYLFLLPALIIFGVFFVYPNIHVFYLSLFRWSGLSPRKFFIGFENYRKLFFEDTIWVKAVINTAIIAVQSICIQLPIALALAIILNKKIKGAGIFASIIFFPIIISLVAIAMVWTWMYNPEFGLINKVLDNGGLGMFTREWLGDPKIALFSVIVTINWVYIGLYVVIFTAGLKSISKNIFDAAKVDGLSELQIARRITVPLLKEVIAVTIIMCITGSFKTFDLIWVMTYGGPAHATEIAATHLYRMGFRRLEAGYASTIGVIIFFICLIAIAIQLKIMRAKIAK